MFNHPQQRRAPQSPPTNPSDPAEPQFNPRSSSLPRHPSALHRPVNLTRGIQPLQPLTTTAFPTTPPALPAPSPTTPPPSVTPISRSSYPPNAHPLGAPTLLGIPRLVRERIYSYLLSPRRIRGYPLVPYSTHTFPLPLLLAGSAVLERECRDYAIVHNTFNIVLNGGGMQPGYVFSPTATSAMHPQEGLIRKMCVHMHVDLNGVFVYPGAAVLPVLGTDEDKDPGIMRGAKQLVRGLRHNGMPSLEVVEVCMVEVIPEQLRIYPTCRVNEKHVRMRYALLVERLFQEVKRRVVVRWKGVECVYVPEMDDVVGRGGEAWEEDGEESGGEEKGWEYDGGRGRRQGSEQARVRAREGGGWETAEDYEFLCTESVMEVGKRERGRGRFVDDSAEGMGEGEGYGARELFGVMMRVDQLPAGVMEEEEEVEEEDEEEEGKAGLPVPEQGKKRGLTGLVSQSRLALRLSAGEKEKEKEKMKEEEKAMREAEKLQEKMEKEQEKEAKERHKEKEKLEREREKQRAKAKKEQDKLEKKAEKRRSEGSKGMETQEQKEGLKDKIKWFGPKKDGDEKEPRDSTW